MAARLDLKNGGYRGLSVSPFREMGAYEALWMEKGASFKSIAEKFRADSDALPSDFVEPGRADEMAQRALEIMREGGVEGFGVRVRGAGEYPKGLGDARFPIEVIYYSGWWDLVETPCVAVVGTREPSREGVARATRLTRCLVADGYTVVSGLAKGIDTAAHTAAMEAGGMTIAVLGTPLNRAYPKANAELQRRICEQFLLFSQVPILRHTESIPLVNRHFFPERNVTMSALTLGTIIVEAGETSGTLYQARAALQQGRKLFILDNCFERGLTWPEKFRSQGAIRVANYEDIQANLRPDT